MANIPYPNNFDDDFMNIFKEVITMMNKMGYTYEESLRKAHEILDEAKQTNDMNQDVQSQINNLILSDGESDAEVIQARGSHTTLSDRLNELNTFVGDASILGGNYRSISESLIELGVNVRNFGAKGDGASDDTQAFKNAAEYIGEGVVIIPPGSYIIQGLPMREGLYYKGAGMDATILTLPENATDHMFKAAPGLTDILSGAVEGVSLRGSKSGVTSSYNAFDFSSLSRLERFTIRDVKAEYFDIGYNGTVNDRWAYITNTQFYNNRVAIYAGEHPILVNVDCRSNDIGLTGRLNDLTALNCRFNYNRIGAKAATGTGNYISNSIFQNTGFWGNSEVGIELDDLNLLTSARISGLTTTTDDKGVVIKGASNIISHNFFSQNETTGFGKGAIVFEGDRASRTNNRIEGNNFNLAGGPGIVAHSEDHTQDNIIKDNNVFSRGGTVMHPFIVSNPDYLFRGNTIKGNTILLTSTMNGSAFEIPFVQSKGNNISDNTFIMSGATDIEYVMNIDARQSVIKGNDFVTHSSSNFIELYNFTNQDSATVFKDNKGIPEPKLRDKGIATIPEGSYHTIVSVDVDQSLTQSSVSATLISNIPVEQRTYVASITNSQFYIRRVGGTTGDLKFSWQVDLT